MMGGFSVLTIARYAPPPPRVRFLKEKK